MEKKTILNNYIRHVMKRELYSNTLKEIAVKYLKSLYDEMITIIKITPFVSSKRRYNETLANIHNEIDIFKTRYKDFLTSNIYEMSDAESIWISDLFKTLEKPFIIPEKLQFSLKFTPIGMWSDYNHMIKDLVDKITQRADAVLKVAYLTKEPTADIAERLKKHMDTYTRELKLDMELFNSTIFGMTDYYIYEASESEMRYCSIFDNNICPECGSKSNKIFSGIDAPIVPLHPRCRCFYVENDIIDGLDEIDFETWFNNESESEKLNFLGKSRYKLYKNGVGVKKYIDTGVKMSLSEIKKFKS